jgi:hypothetical protein
MVDSQPSLTTGTGNEQAPALSLEAQLELLLDDIGFDFVMHTHHPLAHLEYVEQVVPTAGGEFNIRNECGDPPTTATPSGSPFPTATLADL